MVVEDVGRTVVAVGWREMYKMRVCRYYKENSLWYLFIFNVVELYYFFILRNVESQC